MQGYVYQAAYYATWCGLPAVLGFKLFAKKQFWNIQHLSGLEVQPTTQFAGGNGIISSLDSGVLLHCPSTEQIIYVGKCCIALSNNNFNDIFILFHSSPAGHT